jgi:hypothetical protein
MEHIFKNVQVKNIQIDFPCSELHPRIILIVLIKVISDYHCMRNIHTYNTYLFLISKHKSVVQICA